MRAKRLLFATILVLTLVISMASIVSASTIIKSTTLYKPTIKLSGVLEKDRIDYMNADGNPLHEDIANYVYGGPGTFDSPSVGYMKSIHLNLTNLGTIYYLNYTGEEYTFTYYNGSTYSLSLIHI